MVIKYSAIKNPKLKAAVDAALAECGYTKPKRNKRTALGRTRTYSQGVVDTSCSLFVRITRIVKSSDLFYDRENLIGGAKQLQDAIAAFLSKKGDDKKDGIEFEYRQDVGDKTETLIEIFDAQPAR